MREVHMEYICELKNVSKRFHTINNETKAIDDISFKVRKGEIVSIVGPSGSGKSTVLSLIAGLEKPSEGEVIVNTKSIGFMFQKDQLYEWRNVYRNCLLGLEVKNMDNEENKIKVKMILLSKILQNR
jgi:NitT/TauT family transport system ATP-binding protein